MEDAQHRIREGDLLAYLEGKAPAAIARLIEQSPALLAEVAALRATDRLLYEALDPAAAVDLDDLLLYQAGLLDPADRQAVEAALAAHPELRALLDQLALPDPASAAPTISLRERLRQAGRQILDALQLPASPQPAAAALRGAESQRLHYQAGGYRLILVLIAPALAGGIWQVEGHIDAEADRPLPEGASVSALRASDDIVASDSVDESGFFALDQLEAGTYTIQIDLADASILIGDLALL